VFRYILAIATLFLPLTVHAQTPPAPASVDFVIIPRPVLGHALNIIAYPGQTRDQVVDVVDALRECVLVQGKLGVVNPQARTECSNVAQAVAQWGAESKNKITELEARIVDLEKKLAEQRQTPRQ